MSPFIAVASWRALAVLRTAAELRIPEHVVAWALTSPSATLGYHGADHCAAVALRAVDGARALGLDGRALFLAGLFHDADYRLAADERSNIEAAVAHFHACPDLRVSDGPDADAIIALIRATAYPHATTDVTTQAVLQDADLLMCLEPDFDVTFLPGLTAEGAAADPNFPRPEMLHTDWAGELLAAHRSRTEAAA